MTFLIRDRAEFTDAVRAQAWDEGTECPTCHGEGRVRPGRRVVHCMGSFTGADWDEEAVLSEIGNAVDVRWVDHLLDHDLAVTGADGHVWHFAVTRPEAAEGAVNTTTTGER